MTTRFAFVALICAMACLTGARAEGAAAAATQPAARPNVILCMTDDQGWGDAGYNGHPVLKTPELDALAAAGVRFDHFYAAHFNCSPTRGSVLTGRHPNRFGCFSHGYPIRPQEVTVAQVAKAAGYATGHFGKWHLNDVRGPGRPVLVDDPLSPGRMGFDEWVTASNFFDIDPSLARNGVPESFTGDGSDVVTDEALKFIRRSVRENKPFLAVVWFGSPHTPHRALPRDKAPYADRPPREQNYYGELAAVDRSVGRLRKNLRQLGIADDTIFWFCSDNGGAFGPASTGRLRGQKGTLWEGGVRVPGLLEWPARIRTPFITDVPCSTMDIYPTLVELLGAAVPNPPRPIDGVSLVPLIDGKMAARPKPIPFWDHVGPMRGHAALIDWPYKLHQSPVVGGKGQAKAKGKAKGEGPGEAAAPAVLLYDLSKDPKESRDLAAAEPERAATMKAALVEWQASVEDSLRGRDYR